MTTVTEEQNKLPAMIQTLKKNMKDWKTLPKNFIEGISLCSFSTASDLSRGVFACVALHGKASYSIDSNRSSLFEFDTEFPGDTIFVTGKDSVELAKFPVVEYCTDKKWGHFRTEEGVTFSCSLMNGEFPFEKMIPTFNTMSKLPHIQLPKDLKGVVDNVNMLASSDTYRAGKIIYVEICGKEILVRASNELGEVEKVISCDYADEEINIGINSNLLSQILQRATKLSRDGNMLHFQSGSFQHILMAIPKQEGAS
jgi:DNA polymerase III sliding clamp (beta) subunit (PCNA family)